MWQYTEEDPTYLQLFTQNTTKLISHSQNLKLKILRYEIWKHKLEIEPKSLTDFEFWVKVFELCNWKAKHHLLLEFKKIEFNKKLPRAFIDLNYFKSPVNVCFWSIY